MLSYKPVNFNVWYVRHGKNAVNIFLDYAKAIAFYKENKDKAFWLGNRI